MWCVRHVPQNRDLFMTGGGNGGFNLYKHHYPASRTALAKDNQPVGVTGSIKEQVATANIGCLTHLQAGSALPVRHWIELIDEVLA